jgi:diguanylate cyclase (GGDEF)-like protein/hemerythrin-like metal-binding protein/PAS domain S-box-containing protein
VRLQLKWHHQFQFAGYYAAKEKGYYQATGLDVDIIPGKPGDDPAQKVLQGEAEFGVGSTELLLLREQGRPLVTLAVIFQHSPLALMTLKQSSLQSIHDLAGRKVMIEPGSAELYAYLQKEGLTSDKFTLIPHTFHAQDLLAGTVDAMSVYVTDEPFDLNKAKQEYQLYSPRSNGIDFYGDNLFTTESQLKLKPEMVKAFRAATLKGWEYAMQHQEELVQLIYSRYSQRHSIEHLRFEARQMEPLLQASLVEIGHMNPGRWRHIADTYAGLGMMKPGFDFKGFLYDPNPTPPDLKWLYGILFAVVSLLLIVTLVAIRFVRLSSAYTRSIAEQKRIEESLRFREAKYRVLTENMKDVVWTLDTQTMRFLYVSPSVLKLRGYTPEEIITESLDASLTPEAAILIKSLIRQRIDENSANNFPSDVFYTNIAEQPCKDGTIVWTEVITNYYLNEETGHVEIQGVTRDITERKKAEEKLQEANHRLEALSITDALTDIANRRHFDTVLVQEHARHARSGVEFSLILLDIDHFKAFNDNYGHVKGDECLRLVGRVLTACAIRPADLAARYGGEEFACILPETDSCGAIIIAEKIRRGIQALAIPHKASSAAECVTASLGVITQLCVAGEPIEGILAKADELLYRAKSSGRNRVEYFAAHDITMPSGAEEISGNFVRLTWEESFCSGNLTIDTQHRSLFNVSNKLLEAVLSERSSTEISDIITQLLDDVSQHFHDEQMILETASFPGLNQHVIEHAKLLAKGFELSEQFKAATLSVGDVFQFLVSDVVMVHMLGADRQYFPFIRENPRGVSP